MKKIIRLTESDLTRIIRQIIKEEECLETPKWLKNFKIGQKEMSVVCHYLTWYSNDYNEGRGFKVLVDLEKPELAVTVCSMDDTLGALKSISGGKQETNKSNGCPEFIYTFSNSEEGGDLNDMLDEINTIFSSDKLKESDLTRIIRRVINETTEIDEFFNPFKRKKNDDEHYIKVKKFRGKNDVKLFSRLEPKEVNGVVTFTIDRMEDNGQSERVGGDFRLNYFGREKAKDDGNGNSFLISDGEQTRLLNKYFGGTISRGNK
jgi:hypothetical protein